MSFITPTPYGPSYTCPHCAVIAQQRWWSIAWDRENYGNSSQSNIIRVGTCTHCANRTLWIGDTMYYPDTGNAQSPNPEMPENVKKIYLEAASIQLKSPRGATALLRLAIQLLCKELGESGTNINSDIGNLVKNGLPEIVQRSLDIVRVTGNDAVHPGQIDTDNIETCSQLFSLINIIVEYMIALPKKVSGLYSALPNDKIVAITNRDRKN